MFSGHVRRRGGANPRLRPRARARGVAEMFDHGSFMQLGRECKVRKCMMSPPPSREAARRWRMRRGRRVQRISPTAEGRGLTGGLKPVSSTHKAAPDAFARAESLSGSIRGGARAGGPARQRTCGGGWARRCCVKGGSPSSRAVEEGSRDTGALQLSSRMVRARADSLGGAEPARRGTMQPVTSGSAAPAPPHCREDTFALCGSATLEG